MIWMAQALKNECVSKTGENVFICTKNDYTFQKLLLAKFSKVFAQKKKNNCLPFHDKSLCTKPQ